MHVYTIYQVMGGCSGVPGRWKETDMKASFWREFATDREESCQLMALFLRPGFSLARLKQNKLKKTIIPAHGADLAQSFAKQNLGLSDTISLPFYLFIYFSYYACFIYFSFSPMFSHFSSLKRCGGQGASRHGMAISIPKCGTKASRP